MSDTDSLLFKVKKNQRNCTSKKNFSSQVCKLFVCRRTKALFKTTRWPRLQPSPKILPARRLQPKRVQRPNLSRGWEPTNLKNLQSKLENRQKMPPKRNHKIGLFLTNIQFTRTHVSQVPCFIFFCAKQTIRNFRQNNSLDFWGSISKLDHSNGVSYCSKHCQTTNQASLERADSSNIINTFGVFYDKTD